jgi:hypothetical protein
VTTNASDHDTVVWAFAGRRSPSLPPAAEASVRRRLRALLERCAPVAVVGAAACGADLVLVTEALRLRKARGRPDVHLVLPTPLAQFRSDSVAPAWRERFRTTIEAVQALGHLTILDLGDDDPYGRGNTAIFERAEQVARDRGGRVLALVVASPGAGRYAARFAEQAQARGHLVRYVDPAADGDPLEASEP